MIEVKCPSCGAPNKLASREPDVEGFCDNCGYPLFLADIPALEMAAQRARTEAAGDEPDERRPPGVQGLKKDETIECWFCRELLVKDAKDCWRCLQTQPKPEEPQATKTELELPAEPPPVEETQDSDPKDVTSLREAFAAVVVLLAILLLVVLAAEII